jgi:hypothetical protein
MRRLVYAGGFDYLMDMGFESKEPVIKPFKPTDAQQIVLGESEDSSDQGRSDDSRSNERHQPYNRLTVDDVIEREQFHRN